MFRLFNKITWGLSLVLGYIISFSFFGLSTSKIGGEDVFFSIFWGIIVGVIIKNFVFSESYIKDRLEFFASQVASRMKDKDYIPKINNEDNNIIHKKESIASDNSSNFEDFNSINKLEPVYNKENNLVNDTISKKVESKFTDSINAILKEKPRVSVVNSKVSSDYNREVYVEDNILIKGLIYFFTAIKNFFSTNILAKLGSVLVFLAVVYFLKGAALLMWDIIGPVGRITLGIMVGFITYIFGIKLYSKSKNEGLILLGLGILINYAVILAGRYLVGDNGYLTEGTTFLFLILNTLFAVVTSLIYNSRTLLIFSFIFAYFNPFIIGAESNGTPYTLIGYSLIVSLGALFVASKKIDLPLMVISFILGNFLFLIAPFGDSIGWSSKILLTLIFCIISILTIVRSIKNFDKGLLYTFIGSYLYIVLNIIYSGGILGELLSFFVYNSIFISLFIFTIWLIATYKNFVAKVLLFVPIFFIIGISLSGQMLFFPYVILGVLFTYMIGFVFIFKNISDIFTYIFFSVLAVFLFLLNIIYPFSLDSYANFNTSIIYVTGIIFILFSYFYSFKEKLTTLYIIGTLGTIFIIGPGIFNDLFINFNKHHDLSLISGSIITIIIISFLNLLLPLVNAKLVEKDNLSVLLGGSILGAIYITFHVYFFGSYLFPGITLGFALVGVAILYFLQSLILLNKLGIEKVKKDNELKNTIFNFLGISISIFSIAIAFIFSDYPEIISATWLFEATILYYFYSRGESNKIFSFATILFFIGLIKFFALLFVVKVGDYQFLVSFTVILISFILNLFFINIVKDNSGQSIIHNFGHIIGMGIMGLLLLKIIHSTGHGWNILGLSIFITLLGSFYAKLKFDFLKITFLLVIANLGLIHIGSLFSIFNNLSYDNLNYLKSIQYLSTLILISNIFIWKKLNQVKSQNYILYIIIGLYTFLISNYYVYDIFNDLLDHLSLTLYWGLIASVLLTLGIINNVIKYRTIGLYFLTLTSVKIFVYDLGGLDNTNQKVFAFLVLGIIFILISTLYTRRYGDNLLAEFNLSNIFDKKEDDMNSIENVVDDNINNISINRESFKINEKIKDIDISDLKSVKFKINNGETVNIRTQNLLKVSRLLIKSLGKNVFEAGELEETYNYIIHNYKTELPKASYDKLLGILKEFVEKGGEVELIYK